MYFAKLNDLYVGDYYQTKHGLGGVSLSDDLTDAEQLDKSQFKLFRKYGFKIYKLQEIEVAEDEKLVMPKVFDDFTKHFNLKEQQGEENLDGALAELFKMYMEGGSEYDELENYMRTVTKYDDAFYADCVNACVYGYEVEDDE